MPITANTRILDMGCGEGLLLHRLNKRTNIEQLYGVDISKKAIKYLNNNFENISGCVQDIHNLSFPDNSFDIIFCVHILEHSDNPKYVLSEIYRMLNNSSICIIEVPLEDVKKPRKNIGHFSVFRKEEELLEIIREYFGIIDTKKTGKNFLVKGEKSEYSSYSKTSKERKNMSKNISSKNSIS